MEPDKVKEVIAALKERAREVATTHFNDLLKQGGDELVATAAERVVTPTAVWSDFALPKDFGMSRIEKLGPNAEPEC